MKSFGLLRTNVGLTTNIKIMVSSDYSLALDSIDSTTELSYSKYKKKSFNKSNYYDDLVQFFFNETPSEIAYNIKYEDDSNSMTDNFSSQYDEIYQYGARNILSNKFYNEEFEYFAPLYIVKNRFPKNFVIFRVDGPGITNLTRLNIKKEVFNKLKCVKVYDLTKNTALGEWFDLNFNSNNFFPETPFDMSYTRLEFSKWNGIDFKHGGYVSKSMFFDDILEEEKEIFELEKFIFDGYKNNNVVFPNILNLSFLFDDTPADEDSLRKWSINRYYGFYLDDMELIKTVSPYIPPFLKDDITIEEGNILQSPTGDPFLNGWMEDRPYYVEYNGQYYKVVQFTETLKKSVNATSSVNQKKITTNRFNKRGTYVEVSTTQLEDIDGPVSNTVITDQVTTPIVKKWRIISDIDLKGKGSLLNKNIGYIDSTKKIIKYDLSNFQIDEFDTADVWLIEIDGMYHNLKKENGSIKLHTDYSFTFGDNDYSYYINKSDQNYTKKVSFLVDNDNLPKKFNIYRLKFSDIKDFDDRIVDTEFSKFEYEKENELTITDETKMYLTNLNSDTHPKQLDDFRFKEKVVNIPVASEYTANHEIFKISDNELSPIWRKNPIYCRWAFEGSLSANDQPYLINNSIRFEDYNRTANPFDPNPQRIERNLDYFYTINSSTYSYQHHSLHIENNSDNGLDTNFKFNFNKYLGKDVYLDNNGIKSYNVDYFSYFFSRKTSFLKNTIKKNVKKYSTFLPGDKATPNITLFKGVKYSIYDVENVKRNTNDQIEIINMKSTNRFDGYKFSILLTSEDNGMKWNTIRKWEMDKKYTKDTIVCHDDILYISTKDTICTTPVVTLTNSYLEKYDVKSAPYNQMTTDPALSINFSNDFNPSNSNDWKLYNSDCLLWSPSKNYTNYNVVYSNGDYYYYDNTNNRNIDFWNPLVAYRFNNSYTSRTAYSKDTVVIFKGEYYKSTINGNLFSPENTSVWTKVDPDYTKTKWNPINVWNPSISYTNIIYVTHNKVLYKSINNTITIPSGEIPGVSDMWIRVYSFEQDTDYNYQPKDNPIISMNSEYYMILANPQNKTLENGIKIFINKRNKNILINIFVNDNTTSNLYAKDRDDIYVSINKKLTLTNFIDSINNLSLKYGFSDYINYVVIEEDGTTNTYNYSNNIESLPYIIFAERPEPLDIKVDSLSIKPIKVDKLKPTKILIDGRVNNFTELNYFNNTHIANQIDYNKDTLSIGKNYSGGANVTKDRIYRFSGNYMPLFYDVDIFKLDNSIEYNEINVCLEISEPQKVIFILERNNIISETVYDMLPGLSYSTITDFYTQIVNNIKDNDFINDIEFKYEVNKIGNPIDSNIILDLSEDSYNEQQAIWVDKSINLNNFDTKNNNKIKYYTTDLYPGPYIYLPGITASIITSNNPINISDNISFESFVYFEKTGIFMGNDSTYLYFDTDDRLKFFNIYKNTTSQIPVTLVSKPLIKTKIWYHIVVTSNYDKVNNVTKLKIYVDGEDMSDYTNSIGIIDGILTGSQLYNNDYFIIGDSNQNPNGNNPFGGRITNVRIYSVSLTSDQIYNNFVNQHKQLSIKYKSIYGDIKLTLKRIYPSLIMNIVDFFVDNKYDIQLGATGGNPPYEWSIDNGPFSTDTFIPDLDKTSDKIIYVRDSIGLTASNGYYTLNSGSYKNIVVGTFSYP